MFVLSFALIVAGVAATVIFIVFVVKMVKGIRKKADISMLARKALFTLAVLTTITFILAFISEIHNGIVSALICSFQEVLIRSVFCVVIIMQLRRYGQKVIRQGDG